MLNIGWAHAGPSILAAFLASLVEFVEALTVVLAIGSVRGWRDALLGSAAALGVMLVLIVALGGALARTPLGDIQLVVGALLLLFGLRWLRKAILRSAGVIPLHDEAAAFGKHAELMRAHGGRAGGWDRVAFAGAFQITMLEGKNSERVSKDLWDMPINFMLLVGLASAEWFLRKRRGLA